MITRPFSQPAPITMPTLVLASTSPFRQQLLRRLELPFETAAPEVDESPLPAEAPQHLVARLAEAKARAARQRFPDALIIGSDQVAVIDGDVLGKPGTHAGAVAQLHRASGRRVDFLTGLCLFNSRSGQARTVVEPFAVVFRALSDETVQRYLERERPYHCAGSFKSEGLGIALFEKLVGDDPNTLIGLPLIRLVDLLEAEGIRVI